jgi:hypothetical protein
MVNRETSQGAPVMLPVLDGLAMARALRAQLTRCEPQPLQIRPVKVSGFAEIPGMTPRRITVQTRYVRIWTHMNGYSRV